MDESEKVIDIDKDGISTFVDLNKISVSIITTIFTAWVGYYVFSDINFHWTIYLSGAFLFLALLLSIFSIGKVIDFYFNDTHIDKAISKFNLSFYFLAFGIGLLTLVHPAKFDLENVIDKAKNSKLIENFDLVENELKNIEIANSKYIMVFETDSANILIHYSLKSDEITTLKINKLIEKN